MSDTSERIDELVERAVAMARAVPEDPYCGLAAPEALAHDFPALDLVDPVEPTPETLIERAAAAEDAARAVPGVTNSEGAEASWANAFDVVREPGFATIAILGLMQVAIFLLWLLGADLPGAVVVRSTDGDELPPAGDERRPAPQSAGQLRFSLAGIQLKFSAVLEAQGGLTIESIPNAGEEVRLRGTANLSSGGPAIDRPDAIHPENRAIAEQAAGGIRQAKQAVQHLVLVHETVGREWLTPELYRLGASSLLNDVLMQLRKERTGAYQSGDYFTRD